MMMTVPERFKCVMEKKPLDRLPAIEWAPFWNLTIDRWKKEGLPKNLNSVYEIQDFFGLDKCCQTMFSWETENTPQPAHYGEGIIKSEADYEKILPSLYPEPEFSKEHIEWLKKTHEKGDTLHFFTVHGFFWMPRVLFGIEPHFFSFYDMPDLYKRICSDYSDWVKKAFEYAMNVFPFDFMSFAEDMSYNNGPMLSKELFDQFLLPYYKKTIPMLKGYTYCFIDSDGDITKAVDWYAQAGADGMFPLERQAGVDVALYIEKQPDMAFLGHFDKMCMKFGEKAMMEEFERLLPSARKGKFIFSCDHQTPPDVSIDNYRIYVKLLKKYAALAAVK